jgi:hypothetical protein
MSDTLKDVPEFFESVLGESVIERTNAIGKATGQSQWMVEKANI